jgi:lysozyme
METELEFTAFQIPDDHAELASIPPDGASEDGLTPTVGLPLETSRRPDLEPGVNRWLVEAPVDGGISTAAQQHCGTDGMHMIEGFEGFSAKRYLDSVGVPTIGYGTTSAVIFPLPQTCTRPQAEGWLRLYVSRSVEPAIRGMGVPLNGHEFDACCSAGYNLGPGIFSSASTFGRLLRARQFRQAADALLLYDHAGGTVLSGLARRRQAERQLFLEPMPAPADPHHLSRFPNQVFPIAGHRINERAAVTQMYQLLEHKAQNTRQIRALMPSIVLLRKRVWAVAQFAHPPKWGSDFLGWRWQQLNALTQTKV